MTPSKGQHTKPLAERKGRAVVVRMTEGDRKALTAIARRHKLPITFFIREGIQLVIAKYERAKA